MEKTVQFISSKKQEFAVTVLKDKGKGFLNLQVNRAGGKYQRFLNVPKQNTKKHIVKSCWFNKGEKKSNDKPTTTKSTTKPDSSQEKINQ